jgi:hypothetical protein
MNKVAGKRRVRELIEEVYGRRQGGEYVEPTEKES